MKARLLLVFAISAALLILAVGVVLAQELPPDEQSAASSAEAASAATAPWLITTVDSTTLASGVPDFGQYASVAIDPSSGTSWVSYYDATNHDLRVARYVGSGGNCGTGNTWSCETVDSAGSVGQHSSIAVAPGGVGVGIAYYDATNYALKYALYTCILGPCTWTLYTIEDGSLFQLFGRYASLEYDSSGAPHIAYHERRTLGDDRLKHAYYVGAPNSGNCGPDNRWQCDVIDSGDRVGEYASLDANGANDISIAYYDGGNGALKHAMYVGPGVSSANCGDNAWHCRIIDPPIVLTDADVGRYASSRLGSSGTPHIAYFDATSGTLKYAKYVGDGGNCGWSAPVFEYEWQCDVIDDVGTAAVSNLWGISLALDDNGSPIIAYRDSAYTGTEPDSLNVAYPTLVGNCGPTVTLTLPPWGSIPVHLWQCDILDNALSGLGYCDEGAYVSIATNSAGLATVAYYESDSRYSTGRLKVARQRSQVYLPLVVRNY